jgi:hypothetical protein
MAMILRVCNGRIEMAEFTIKAVPGGIWAWVACRLERPDLRPEQQQEHNPVYGHWLAPSPIRASRHVIVQPIPYVWVSPHEAVMALEQWDRQEEQK